MTETNPLEDCLKRRRFRVILTGKRPLSHWRSFIQLGGYPAARWRHCWRMLRSRMWYLVSIYIYESSLHCSWGECRHSSVEQTEAQNYSDIHPSCFHSCKWQLKCEVVPILVFINSFMTEIVCFMLFIYIFHGWVKVSSFSN